MASSRRSGRPDRSHARADRHDDPVDEAVRASLRVLREDDCIVVAVSGGVDSTVLLDALAQCWPAQRIVAWHVHHGLQPRADRWLESCEREALRLGVRFGATRLPERPAPAGNLEGWARKARYEALWEAVAQVGAAALVTAHQADDQLETVFMQLARGSGPEALGGMSPAQRRKGGWLLRPLLSIGRERIVARARERALEWVEDPMNEDERFLRVALRRRVLPALAKCVPSLRESVLRSAELLRESGETLRWLASKDLREAGLAHDARSIDRGALAALPRERRDRAVRAWFDTLGAPMPARARLDEWVAQMLLAASALAEVEHAGWRFRRYRERIEAEPTPRRVARARPVLQVQWHGESEIDLPGWQGRLRFEPSDAIGAIDARWLAAQPLEVRAAPGHARLRPDARGSARSVRNLWQEHGVPPWLRASMPAVFAGERLLFVAGLGTDREKADAVPGAKGAGTTRAGKVLLEWRPDDPEDPRAAYCRPRASV